MIEYLIFTLRQLVFLSNFYMFQEVFLDPHSQIQVDTLL